MQRPRLHLISNAHLDPVWQWRWEEGCAAALATFRTAVEILRERPGLIFNHNEAILYRWVERYDPPLFDEIRALVREGRWAIAGGWDLQPDVNLPGLESLVRHVLDGRRWFRDRFGVEPRVAWNFDSFGHPAGLPQVLRRAGYRMYIHMRPQPHELELPADLYRWRGCDGSEVLAYRISVGLYHTERDNLEERLREGAELALRLARDVPVFWGLGDHGGGPTREDLDRIDAFRAREGRVEVVHSSAEMLLDALEEAGRDAPVVEGDLGRCFAGCYTSLSRLKRRARESLGLLVGTEALCAAAWWARGAAYPSEELRDAWRDHLFNDFHDILPGTATASAEGDALDLYGRSSETARRARLGAVVALAGGSPWPAAIPVVVAHTVPSVARVPVEVECMLDERPRLEGEWHLELFDRSGAPIPCQEEGPEGLLPFNGWRRKVSFIADLPGVGARLFRLEAAPGKARRDPGADAPAPRIDPATGLVGSLDVGSLHVGSVDAGSLDAGSLDAGSLIPGALAGDAPGPGCGRPEAGCGRELLAGPLLAPVVARDDADSWGSDVSSWREDVGRFVLASGPREIERGPVRVVVESVLTWGRSRIVVQAATWAGWPAALDGGRDLTVVDLRLRIHWNEERRRLALSVPTTFAAPRLLVEVPGGAVERPADGTEHVHGRWLVLEGEAGGRPAAIGIANSGQHGIDLAGGELRLSVLRSAAYCHEKGFALGDRRAWRFMDQGVHDVRLYAAAGDPEAVRAMMPGLADLIERPPFALAHLPPGAGIGTETPPSGDRGDVPVEVAALRPATVRLVALKRSEEGEALVVRLHETAGLAVEAELRLAGLAAPVRLALDPFELKTVRVERDGTVREVDLIGET